MPPSALLFPVFVQVLLTFMLMFFMGRARTRFLKASNTHLSKIALREQEPYPVAVRQIANAYHNQLELPILFYAVTLFAIILNRVDITLVAMAWAFVTLRVVHAVIHATSNKVRQRAIVFALGALVLFLMWVWLAVKAAL